MIDANGNVRSSNIKKGGNAKQKKKMKQNGVILGRATDADANYTDDSSVFTDNFNEQANMTQTFSSAQNGMGTMVSNQKGQQIRGLGMPSDGK